MAICSLVVYAISNNKTLVPFVVCIPLANHKGDTCGMLRCTESASKIDQGADRISFDVVFRTTDQNDGKICTKIRIFCCFFVGFFFKQSMVTLVLNKLKKHCIRLSIVGCIRQPLRNLLRPYLTTRILQLVTTEEGVKPACIKKHACSNDHDLTDIVIARSWL